MTVSQEFVSVVPARCPCSFFLFLMHQSREKRLVIVPGLCNYKRDAGCALVQECKG